MSVFRTIKRNAFHWGVISPVAFILFHLLLLYFYPVRVIDIEILEYGEFAASYLHGFSGVFDVLEFMFVAKEGSQVIMGPFFIPFFYLLGINVFSLKVTGVLFSSLFVAVWFPLMRRVYPSCSVWIIAVLFIFPLPLLQISALSGFSMMTHLGATTWYGLLIYLLTVYKEHHSFRGTMLLVALSILVNIGIFYHPTLLALLPGFFYLALKRKVLSKPLFFVSTLLFSYLPYRTLITDQEIVFFTEKQFVLIFSLLFSIATFSYLLLTKKEKIGFLKKKSFLFAIMATISLLIIAAVQLVDTRDASIFFSSLKKAFWGLLYLTDHQLPFLAQRGEAYRLPLTIPFAIFIAISMLLKKKRDETKPLPNSSLELVHSIVISSISMFVALIVSGLGTQVRLHIIDGVRYFAPFLPLLFVWQLYPVHSTRSKSKWIYLLFLLLFNLGGSILFTYPFKSSSFLQEAKGSIGNFPLIKKNIDREKLFKSPHKNSLIPWYGVRAFHLFGLEGADQVESIEWDRKETILFWIGVGMGQNIVAQRGEYQLEFDEEYDRELVKSCFLNPKKCSLDSIDKNEVREAIKIGWLIVTPCRALEKVLKHWWPAVSNIKNILWSKPDIWSCHKKLNWEIFNDLERVKTKERNGGLTKFFDSLFPLEATTYMPRVPEGSSDVDYFIYASSTWFEYVDMLPGSKSIFGHKSEGINEGE